MPSGENTPELNPSLPGALGVFLHLPSALSHIFAMWEEHDVRASEPSAENSADQAGWPCPHNVGLQSPVGVSQCFAAQSDNLCQQSSHWLRTVQSLSTGRVHKVCVCPHRLMCPRSQQSMQLSWLTLSHRLIIQLMQGR